MENKDSKKKDEQTLEFYKNQYMQVLRYHGPIELPFELNEKFKKFAIAALDYLPRYIFESSKDSIIDEIIDNLSPDNLVKAEIASYKFKIYQSNKNKLVSDPDPKQMLEILFVTLFANSPKEVWEQTVEKYKLTFDRTTTPKIYKQLLNHDNDTKEVVFQIWQEILKQTPKNEFVKKFKSIINSNKSYEPHDLYHKPIEVFLKEGSRTFVQLIKEKIQK